MSTTGPRLLLAKQPGIFLHINENRRLDVVASGALAPTSGKDSTTFLAYFNPLQHVLKLSCICESADARMSAGSGRSLDSLPSSQIALSSFL